jgi:hypothetical protein
MTTKPGQRRRRVALTTTAAAAIATGATVGWAASHPVAIGPGPQTRPAPTADSAALDRTAQQVAAARAALARVRAGLAALIAEEDRLPRPSAPRGSFVPAAEGGVPLPPPPAAPVAVAPAQAAPPPVQGSTGASVVH